MRKVTQKRTQDTSQADSLWSSSESQNIPTKTVLRIYKAAHNYPQGGDETWEQIAEMVRMKVQSDHTVLNPMILWISNLTVPSWIYFMVVNLALTSATKTRLKTPSNTTTSLLDFITLADVLRNILKLKLFNCTDDAKSIMEWARKLHPNGDLLAFKSNMPYTWGLWPCKGHILPQGSD